MFLSFSPRFYVETRDEAVQRTKAWTILVIPGLLRRAVALLAIVLVSAASPAFAVQSPPPAKPATQTQGEQKPVPKTYPGDVKEAFLRSCVGFHKELIGSCKCMILTFERMVPYDQFEELMSLPDPTQDARFTKVAGACLKAQQQ